VGLQVPSALIVGNVGCRTFNDGIAGFSVDDEGADGSLAAGIPGRAAGKAGFVNSA
jgi:hypothetical protein